MTYSHEDWTRMQTEGMRNVASESNIIDCRFSIGDTVMLKSGGEIMVVASYPTPLGTIECSWFKKGEVKYHFFPQQCLKAVGKWKRFWNTNA